MSAHENQTPQVPGVPGTGDTSLEEPTTPREPLPPKPDQGAPERVSSTGAPTDAPMSSMAQQGEYLTTAHGTRLGNSDQSLKAGPRGPVLLQDHLSLIHISEPTRRLRGSRMPSSA